MNGRCAYVIAYDIGSTSNKTCLYRIDKEITLLAETSEKYPLIFVENGGVEQNPDDWWDSMRKTTPLVLREAGISSDKVEAISFCSQMQGLVLVGKDGDVLRPAMSYMDKRATDEYEEWCSGLISIADMNARRTLTSLMETGVTAGSAKDPVFRYNWVKKNEPEVFEKIYKWLDVKDYLVFRATGLATSSGDSAFATMVYSDKKKDWGEKVLRLHGVKRDHLPRIVNSTDMVGTLTAKAGEELGLSSKCKVFSGGGDSTLIGVGAGSTCIGNTHVYIGTSGWVSTVVAKPMVDIRSMIASVVGAQSGRYNYFAEMETSGKCIEWMKEHCGEESIDEMLKKAALVPAGSNGVLFLPWLLGNRCPFEDANSRGGFFNISLTTTKDDMARAVIEGILYHKRWMLDRQIARINTSSVIRMVGGGARSDLICQIFADMTGLRVERTTQPQDAGALGAAILMAYGLEFIDDMDAANTVVEVDRSFEPDSREKEAYQRNYAVFRRMHRKNKKNFFLLNGR